ARDRLLDRMAFPFVLVLGAPIRAAAAFVAVGLALAPLPAAAQQAAPVEDKRVELARLQDEIKLSDEVVARLQAQIRALDADRAKLAADLVATAARTRDTEAKVDAAEGRLSALSDEEGSIKASLASRKGLLVEVIASLQRMGHHPPPA